MYYKILPENMTTHGYTYHLGLNRMEHPENLGETLIAEDGETYEAGLYFADAENILAYCHYGDLIATVDMPNGANLEYWGNGEYSTDTLEILRIRPLWNVHTLQELMEEGVNFDADDDAMLFWAKEKKKMDIADFLERLKR